MTRNIRSAFRVFLLAFTLTACLCAITGCSAAGISNFLHGGSSKRDKKSTSQHEFLEISLNAGIGMSVLLILAAYPVFKLENAKAGWTCLTTGIIDLILCLWLNTITFWLAWAAGLVLFAVAIWVAVELYRKRNPLTDAETFLGQYRHMPQTTLPMNTGTVHPGPTNAQASATPRVTQTYGPDPTLTPPPATQP